MKKHNLLPNAILISLFCLSQLPAQQPGSGPRPAGTAALGNSLAVDANTGSVNINHLWLKVHNDGRLGYDSVGGRGLTYPYQYGNLIYADNLVWVGKVFDGQMPATPVQIPELRTGGGVWQAGVQPGAILDKGVAENPDSKAVRVFRYRPDFQTADLTFDASALYGIDPSQVTPTMISETRARYQKDFDDWPWWKGAPFYDTNHNGWLDPGERPGLQNAGQVVWFSYNDLDAAQSRLLAGSAPVGLEVQVTLWAYTGVPNLEDVIFKRYRVLYKGTAAALPTASIDSMYFSQWVDGEVGYFGDDLGGCDSTMSLGYQFSATNPDPVYKNLGGANPALGYAILQGPIVGGSASDDAIVDFSVQPGKRNLPMTAFMLNPTGDPIGEPPYGTRNFWYWNVARGFSAISSELNYRPYVLPDGRTTKYMYAGDPASKTGWIDGLNQMYGGAVSLPPGSRRFMMSTGPFTMNLGDVQEMVLAIIASSAPTGIENVTWLRNRTMYVQEIFPNLGDYVAGFVTSVEKSESVPTEFVLEQNYPNPFNPGTNIRFGLTEPGQAKVVISDIMGRDVMVLQNRQFAAGYHTVVWDGRNSSGQPMPSGTYFCRLIQSGRQQVRKLLLLR